MTTYYVDAAVGNDSNAGTSPGSGDAWATIAKAFATAAAGDLVNIKASASYVQTATLLLTNSGSTSSGPITYSGYTTTPGDGGLATITTSTDSTDLIHLNGQSGILFQNLILTNTAGTPANGITATSAPSLALAIQNCVLDGFGIGIHVGNIGAEFTLFSLIATDTKILNCTTFGARTCSAVFSNCEFTGNAAAFRDGNPGASQATTFSFSDCVFYNQTGAAISLTQDTVRILALDSTAIHTNGSDGLAIGSTTALVLLSIENSIVYNNGGYGVNLPSLGVMTGINRNNAYGANTSGARNNLPAGVNDIALSGDPCVSASAGNFSLNAAAGGGALCRAAGFPGVSLFGTGYADIGPLQHQDAGGGSVFSPIGCAFIKGN